MMNYKDFEEILDVLEEALDEELCDRFESGEIECECFFNGALTGVGAMKEMILQQFKEYFLIN